MAVKTVYQREIVEVPFVLPRNQIKIHPALVLSTEKLLNAESGMFYAILISTKQLNPEFTLKIEHEWLNKPIPKISFLQLILFLFSIKRCCSLFKPVCKTDVF
jgi:hypothetical protein